MATTETKLLGWFLRNWWIKINRKFNLKKKIGRREKKEYTSICE